jgi:ferredoxin-type protein NapH
MNAIKKVFPTLGRVRLLIQAAMLFVTVYGSVFVGNYMADKISSSLPALSCAYNQQNGAYCVLIPLQHQMHHRIGQALVQAQQVTAQILLPLFFTVLSFFVFFVVLNKVFCGWICPLGTVQEWIHKLGRRLRLPFRNVEAQNLATLRPVKWLILLFLVLLFPLLAGLGIAPHSVGNPYCDICPSRLVTTLLTADTEQVGLRTGGWIEFGLGAFANTLAGFVLIAALAVRQPFCRICPMLSWNALFQRLSPMRLVKSAGSRCDSCGICTKACPMDIPEIASKTGRKAFHEDCTLCGRCAEFCPDDGVIQIKFGPVALFKSSRDYYKARMKIDAPDGSVKSKAAKAGA